MNWKKYHLKSVKLFAFFVLGVLVFLIESCRKAKTSEKRESMDLINLVDFREYGEPVKVEDDIPKIWAAFSREFDWKVMGRTRLRVLSENGSPTWKKVLEIDLSAAVLEARKMGIWRKIVSELDSEKNRDILIKIVEKSKEPWMNFSLSENDIVPFIFLDACGEDVENFIREHPGLSLEDVPTQKKIEAILNSNEIYLPQFTRQYFKGQTNSEED